jgi:acyl carrier protein
LEAKEMATGGNKVNPEKVRLLIAEKLGVDESEVTLNASFVDDLGADSLDQVELVMALEEEYGFQVSDEDTEGMQTVKFAIEYVQKHAKTRK